MSVQGQACPWLLPEQVEPEEVVAPTPEQPAPPTGPASPQAGIPQPASLLPSMQRITTASLWWLGVHGGAGETTLAGLMDGWHQADHAWPIHHDGSMAPVVLVCRSHAAGLLQAQKALTQWAAGGAPGVELLGLVIVADAPGRLPKPLRDLAALVSGGAPRTWRIDWQEKWRLGELPEMRDCERSLKDLLMIVRKEEE